MPTTSTADVRAWAKDQGLPIGDRGRIPADVLQAYQRAKSAKRTATKKGAAPRPSAPPPVAAAAVADSVLEPRVAALESQVASLTERLDAAVTALAKRSGPFRLSRKT